MKHFVIAALALSISSVSLAQDLKITGIGENTFRTGTSQTDRHLWMNVSTSQADVSIFAFGWTSSRPEYWIESWAKQPFLKVGDASLTLGAFGSWQTGRKSNTGPALTLEVERAGWSFTSYNYWIMEHGQQPTFFIPSMRLQAPRQGAFRFGVEGSFAVQGSFAQLRLGPTAQVRIGSNASVRMTYLKDTRGGSDQFRTFVSFSF